MKCTPLPEAIMFAMMTGVVAAAAWRDRTDAAAANVNVMTQFWKTSGRNAICSDQLTVWKANTASPPCFASFASSSLAPLNFAITQVVEV